MKKWYAIVLFSAYLVGCNTYQNALKVDDSMYKNEVADQLFEQKKYKKAINLYAQVFSKEKWDQKLASTYYKYGKSLYLVERYELSSAFLKGCNNNFPLSPFREETMYLEAMSDYHLSDDYSQDQSNTIGAIAKFENYLAQFPEGENAEKATQAISELKGKIEKKAYEAAKLYNQIGEYTRDYNAAIVALDNFLLDYPGSKYKEDALFYKFDSGYRLAMNSVQHKKEERLKNAISLYESLISFNESTKYKSQADDMIKRVQNELKQFSK